MVSVRLNAAERETLRQLCAVSGLPVSAVLRQLIRRGGGDRARRNGRGGCLDGRGRSALCAAVEQRKAAELLVGRFYLPERAAQVARGLLMPGAAGAQPVYVQQRHVAVMRGDEPVRGLRGYYY